MIRISLKKFTLQIATMSALVVLSAGVASAQKMADKADKVEDKTESKAVLAAREARKEWLKGIEVSEKEKAKLDDIAKRDDAKFKDYEKQQKADDKLEALRIKERAEVRAALIKEHVKTFDKNVEAWVKKK